VIENLGREISSIWIEIVEGDESQQVLGIPNPSYGAEIS
jgi:hypothetical protein